MIILKLEVKDKYNYIIDSVKILTKIPLFMVNNKTNYKTINKSKFIKY